MANSWNLYKNLHQISSHPQWNPLMIQGWWVTGGLVNSSGSATSTTELFNSSSGTFVKGPDLPFALHKHCLVHIAAGWARSIAMISSFVIFGHFAILPGQTTQKRASDTKHHHLMAQCSVWLKSLIRLTLVIGGTAPTTPPSTLGTSLLYNWTSDSW